MEHPDGLRHPIEMATSSPPVSPTNDKTPLQATVKRMSDPPEIRRWPTEPLKLRRTVGSHVFIRGWDFLTLLLPVPFIILGGIAFDRHGKIVEEKDWYRIQRGMDVAVTAFPVFFAVVMSRLTRAIATWKLERGTTLGTVEQLLGSSTLGSAVMTHFSLRSLNWLSLALLLLWALSPLGGQSSLHIMDTNAQSIGQSVGISFLNTHIWPTYAYSGDTASIASQSNALYLSSILAPGRAKAAPMDTWGNVKIPVLSRLTGQPDAEGWHTVPQDDEVIYTSLLGVPAHGILPYGNTSFNLETSYYDIDCFDLYSQAHPPRLTKGEDLKITPNEKPIAITKLPEGLHIGSNGSYMCEQVGCLPSFGIGMDRYVSNRITGSDASFPSNVTDNTSTFLPEPPVLMFLSRWWERTTRTEDWTSVAQCHINRIHVEVAVTCAMESDDTRPQCAATAIRDSLVPHPPKDAHPFLFSIAMVNFAELLSTAGGYNHPASASLTERFIENSAEPLEASIDGSPLDKLDKPTFSERFTQVWNTYYFSTLRPDSMTGNLFMGTYDRTLQNMSGLYAPELLHVSNVTGSHVAWEPARYRIHAGWMSCFILATLTMLVGAILGALTTHRTIIPDILGYVSTMTRDEAQRSSAFPAGASTLDGLERSRLLRDLPVRLGDVRSGDSKSGYLGFSVADLAQRARRGRLYD